jgi:hypothetical protein
MKYLAHRERDGRDKPISIYDVIKGRKSADVEHWEEGVIYFSLWYHTPMKAIVNVRSKKPHFAFINGSDPGHQDGGESLEHSLSKKIVSELSILKVSVYNVSYEIPVKAGRMEHPEQFKDRSYRIDVMLQAEPCAFTSEYGSTRIGVEIKKSNKVKSRKQQHLRNVTDAMVLLEISLWDKITLDDDYNVEKLYNRLGDFWRKEKIAFCLHNPNYKVAYEKHLEKERQQRIRKPEPSNNPMPARTIAHLQPAITTKPSPVGEMPILPAKKENTLTVKRVLIVIAAIIIMVLYYFATVD